MAITTGLIGIGNMGLAMALRLRDLGRSVGVRDVDADQSPMRCAMAPMRTQRRPHSARTAHR